MNVAPLRLVFCLLIFAALLFGCGTEEVMKQKNVYYSWESYLTAEIAQVTKGKHRLQKSVILDGEKESSQKQRCQLIW